MIFKNFLKKSLVKKIKIEYNSNGYSKKYPFNFMLMRKEKIMEDILKGLNDKQYEAVVNTEGPCLVIADNTT